MYIECRSLQVFPESAVQCVPISLHTQLFFTMSPLGIGASLNGLANPVTARSVTQVAWSPGICRELVSLDLEF